MNDKQDADDAERSVTLVSRTTERLGLDLVKGRFESQSYLPVEAQLMALYGVSRNVLRESIKTLSGKRLLTTRRRAGTFLEPMEQWNFLDEDVLRWLLASDMMKPKVLLQLSELREMIEPEIAAHAALNATPLQALELRQAFEIMKEAQADAKWAVTADIAFHQTLFRATHNQFLMSLLPAFTLLLQANFEMTFRTSAGYIRNLEEHRLIAEAVHLKDAALARQSMSTILANNSRDLAAAAQGR